MHQKEPPWARSQRGGFVRIMDVIKPRADVIDVPRLIPLVILCIGFLVGASPSAAQSRLSGTVTDASTGVPLPSANVFIDGTLQGVATDRDGAFSLTDLDPGRYTVVTTMVGYKRESRTVVLNPPAQADAPPVLDVALTPQPIEMQGVTVEQSRTEWLKRLERFQSSFFGNAPNADACSFINPEVLSFKEKGGALIAWAEKPLRVRNDALGYELTFYLPRYRAEPNRRARYGPVEFDTLAADSDEQRADWRAARLETYQGSYEHFIHALQADTWDEEGFDIWVSRDVKWGPNGRTGMGDRAVDDVRDIVEPTPTPGYFMLVMPERGYHLKVRFTKEMESYDYARTRGSFETPRPNQTSALQLVGGPKFLIHRQTGGARNGRVIQRGYWGWYETASTVLPLSYRPAGG